MVSLMKEELATVHFQCFAGIQNLFDEVFLKVTKKVEKNSPSVGGIQKVIFQNKSLSSVTDKQLKSKD
jgi:hypothetical protein